MENLSSRLRELRGTLSQQQAADAVGIRQQNWARYESGKVLPGAEIIHQICVKFGVSADWLLGLSEEKPHISHADTKTESLKAAIQSVLDRF